MAQNARKASKLRSNSAKFSGGHAQRPPSLASPLRGSLFCITIQEKLLGGPER